MLILAYQKIKQEDHLLQPILEAPKEVKDHHKFLYDFIKNECETYILELTKEYKYPGRLCCYCQCAVCMPFCNHMT